MPADYLSSLYQYVLNITPLPEAAWQAFGAQFSLQRLNKNQYFACTGKVEHSIGFLAEGTVRSFYCDKQGLEYNKTFHVPYSFIGAYSSLTSRQINQINIQALEECLVLVADYRKIAELYEQYVSLERMARKLAERYFAVKEQREIELVMLDAGERYRLFQREFPGLENKIPQYHIASYLGITPTQLSRIRAKKS